jgi:hypothetical protein
MVADSRAESSGVEVTVETRRPLHQNPSPDVWHDAGFAGLSCDVLQLPENRLTRRSANDIELIHQVPIPRVPLRHLGQSR